MTCLSGDDLPQMSPSWYYPNGDQHKCLTALSLSKCKLINEDVSAAISLPGLSTGSKHQAFDMAFNGNGIHDTARGVRVDKNTVISA